MMTASQARAARAMIRWTVAEAGEKAQVSPNTITRVEADRSVNTATLKAISAAYEVAGVVFLPEDADGPGVRLRKAEPTTAEKA